MPKRSALARLEAIPEAMRRGEEFQARVADAAGDVMKCADLMAEAIAMDREANFLEVVARDGRKTMCMEKLQAGYCLDAARTEYLRARGSNQP